MIRPLAATLTVIGVLAVSVPADAHCDTTRGPVVTAARAALDAGDPTLMLHWVRPEDEAAVRTAFQQTVDARATGPAARAVADRYFFETLVRIHRAGEGAAYTGLTAAEPEPIIAATDRALEHGSVAALEEQLVGAVRAGLAERFAAARTAADFRPGDVAAGRAFVGAYVPLTHWVEAVFTAASGKAEQHGAHAGHDAIAQPAVHEPGDHPPTGASAPLHPTGHQQHLPWVMAALFGIAALVEGAFLVRGRRHAAA